MPAVPRIPRLDLADESRRLYEQIAALYSAADDADIFAAATNHFPEPGEGKTAQLLADFLDTVHRVADAGRHADRTDRSLALFYATRRYEADRTGSRG